MKDFFTKQQMKSLLKKGFKPKNVSRYYTTMVRDLRGKPIPRINQVDSISFIEGNEPFFENTPFYSLGEMLDRFPKDICVNFKVYHFYYIISNDCIDMGYKNNTTTLVSFPNHKNDPMKSCFALAMWCLNIENRKWFKL